MCNHEGTSCPNRCRCHCMNCQFPRTCDAYVVNTRSSKYCTRVEGHPGGHKWQAER